MVESADGTRLHVVSAGAGSPVVLVHGTMGSRGDWAALTPRIATTFEVVAYDRRGRGDSDDGPTYAIERELEDVLAVVATATKTGGPPPHLVGHSFGGILALLTAAQAGDRIGMLVLYEPPIGDPDLQQHDWLDELDAATSAGDLDTAVERFATAAGITDQELRINRANERVWAALRDGVRTAAREIRAATQVLPIRHEVLRSIENPTLVLVGAEQDHPTYRGLADLATTMPNARLKHVPGRHLAHVSAPDELAAQLMPFLHD